MAGGSTPSVLLQSSTVRNAKLHPTCPLMPINVLLLGTLGLAPSMAWLEQKQGGSYAMLHSTENAAYADCLSSLLAVSIYVSLNRYAQIHASLDQHNNL